jgi:hypothetical protein
MRPIILSIALFLLVNSSGCGIDEKEVFISGMVDIENVKTAIAGPLLLAVTNTADLEELEKNPSTSILGVFGIDPEDPYYHIDLKQVGIQPEETIYVFAFIDNDFNNIPTPTLGDFIGFYINRKTYKLDCELKEGQNRGIDISVNRQIRDFDATVVYAIDKGDVTYGPDFNTLTTEEVILAVHEDGVNISMKSSGTADIAIDPDYIMGFARFQPPDYDHYTSDPRPKPMETPRMLEIFPAFHVKIAIENDEIVGGVYLFAIIDENGNGTMESDDDVGYYYETTTVAPGTEFEIPGYGTITPPPGDYYYPKTITIKKGENRDSSNADEPYWILYRYFTPAP